MSENNYLFSMFDTNEDGTVDANEFDLKKFNKEFNKTTKPASTQNQNNFNQLEEEKYSSTERDMNMYDFYLTPKEQRLITYLNRNTSNIKTARENHDRLENLSIKTIYKRWSDRTYSIINDLIDEFQRLINTQPSDSLDTNIGELDKYKSFAFNVIQIIVRDDRLLYTGITLVVISLFVYFVSVSSS